MNLFVYGTLLRGECNHHVLDGAKLLCKNCQLPARMYDTGDGYAAIELVEDTMIVGEIYEVPDHMWQSLDELEGHSGNSEVDLYSKETVNVQTSDGLIEAVVYTVCDVSMKSVLISSGDWIQYRKSFKKQVK